MSYSKLLQKIINKTNYTNVEIAEKCKELGVNIDRTYINKLYNGKTNPPKDEVSRAIAKVCNADERSLVIEGYLDRAPKEISDILIHIKYLVKIFSLNIFENNFEEYKDILEDIKSEIEKEPLADFVIDLLNANENDMILLDNNNFNISNVGNDFNVNMSTPIGLSVIDNSMAPLIPENSQITLTLKQKYDNGDIVAFKIKGKEELYTRYFFNNDNKLLLTALNSNFEAINCNLQDIIILGKVSKIIYDI